MLRKRQEPADVGKSTFLFGRDQERRGSARSSPDRHGGMGVLGDEAIESRLRWFGGGTLRSRLSVRRPKERGVFWMKGKRT